MLDYIDIVPIGTLSILVLCIIILVSVRGLIAEVRSLRPRAGSHHLSPGGLSAQATPVSGSVALTPAPVSQTPAPVASTTRTAVPAQPLGAQLQASPGSHQHQTRAAASFPPPQGMPLRNVSSASAATASVTSTSAVAASVAAPSVASVAAPTASAAAPSVPTPSAASSYARAPQHPGPQPRSAAPLQTTAASYPPPHTAPAFQTGASYPPPAASSQQPRGSAESVIGKNIIGIIASALVFIGLVFLGLLVVPLLSDTVKIVALFLISAVITATGAVLARRFANTFTRILLGTGLGAFFISILLAHLWFHVLGEIAAFSLLLFWTVLSLLTARWTHSLLVGIIAHAGMMVSVCAGYGAGLSDERLVLLLVYQFISTVVIVVGNLVCCKRLYRVGLFATLALMLYASGAMWMHFWGTGVVFATTLPVPLIASAFIVQFAGVSILSLLIFTSCLRMRDKSVGLLLHAANLILWLCALVLDVVLLVGKFAMAQVDSGVLLQKYDIMPPMLVALMVALVVVMAAMVVARRMRGFDRAFETLTICLFVATMALALLINLGFMYLLIDLAPGVAVLRLAWLVVPALLLMVLVYLEYSQALHLTAALLLGVEILGAFVYSFREIERFVQSLFTPGFSSNGIDGVATELAASPLAYLPALCALLWLVTLLVSAWLCYRLLPREKRSSQSARSGITLGLALTFEIGVAYLILITPELSPSSFLSLTLMLISFVIIVLGFWQRSSSLRIVGLVVVMVCVLKLVTFDIAGLETLMRVVAFIGGGLICFGISALYTFAVRRYNT